MRKGSRLVTMALIASLVLAFPLPNRAAISDEKDKLNNLEDKKSSVENTLSDLESSKSDTEKYIKEVDGQVSAISTQMYTNQNNLNDVETKIKKTQKKLTAAKKSIESQYASMKLRIKYMYENGDTQMLDLILSSKNIGDFLNKAEYISEISEYDRKMLDKMVETKKEIASSKKSLEVDKKKMVALQSKLESQKKDLQALSDAKAKELKDYKKLIAKGEKTKNSIDNEIENQKKVVAEMESIEKARAEAAKKAAEAARKANNSINKSNIGNNSSGNANTNTATTTDDGSDSNTNVTFSGYIWPLPGHTRVSSGFGYRSDPFTGKQAYHSGIDIPAAAGTAIVAAASGQVAWANYSTTAGNWIGIDHGNGVYTVYMHCSALLVSAGQNVSQGDTIGLVGNTGSSQGNHLHFSVRLNGSYVSPWNYVSN